jgi:hypothetical protein
MLCARRRPIIVTKPNSIGLKSRTVSITIGAATREYDAIHDDPLPDKDKSENFPGGKHEITQQQKSEQPRQFVGFSHWFSPFAELVYQRSLFAHCPN